MEYDPQQFGRLQQEVTELKADVAELRADMKLLLGFADKGRGAWWIALTLVSLVTSAITILTGGLWK